MPVDLNNTYDLWDFENLVIPPHSHLFHLEPIGVGTPYVESLTGYIARLAEEHCIHTGLFILSEIGPVLKKGYVFDNNGGISKIYGGLKNITALNGTGLMASDLVQALEALTLGNELRYLTMLTWAEVLSTRNLFRHVKAWCPICHEEWSAARQVVYEPLIWAIDVVAVCLRHHQRLQTRCSYCHKQLYLLEGRSRPGHCSKCGEWLGIRSIEEAYSREVLSEDELNWQTYVVNNVGDLLATAPHLSSPWSKDRIQKAISAYVNQVAKGNVAAFARLVGNCSRARVKQWRLGKAIPQLSSILQVCYYLEVSLLEFLTGEVIGAVADSLATPFFERITTSLDITGLGADAKNKSEPCFRASVNVSVNCGVEGSDLFFRQHSLPSSSLTSKHSTVVGFKGCTFMSSNSLGGRTQSSNTRRRLDLDGMRATLLAALNESPPPSFFEVRKRLRESPYGGSPYRYCPDLCHAISSRYADYKKAKYLEEMRRHLETVLKSNKYPPPSLLEVVRTLKYCQKELYNYFPDLCHAISSRYLSYRKTGRMERIEKLRQEVRQAALELHAKGVKPHKGNVPKLLTKPGKMRDQEARTALYEVQRELGYEK